MEKSLAWVLPPSEPTLVTQPAEFLLRTSPRAHITTGLPDSERSRLPMNPYREAKRLSEDSDDDAERNLIRKHTSDAEVQTTYVGGEGNNFVGGTRNGTSISGEENVASGRQANHRCFLLIAKILFRIGTWCYWVAWLKLSGNIMLIALQSRSHFFGSFLPLAAYLAFYRASREIPANDARTVFVRAFVDATTAIGSFITIFSVWEIVGKVVSSLNSLLT